MFKTLIILGTIGMLLLGGSKYLTVQTVNKPQDELIAEEILSKLDVQETSQEENPMTYETPPEMNLKENVNYQAIIKTSQGNIKVDLFEKEAPKTVNNFIFLANEGFYNGVIFHRVIKDFMIQGGDPTGTGMGGPGYQFEDEINERKLVKGSLAMANSGEDTNGSQFFVVTAEETPWLDGKHTNFGEVIEGLDIVKAIEATETGEQDKPATDIVIETVEIIEEAL